MTLLTTASPGVEILIRKVGEPDIHQLRDYPGSPENDLGLDENSADKDAVQISVNASEKTVNLLSENIHRK